MSDDWLLVRDNKSQKQWNFKFQALKENASANYCILNASIFLKKSESEIKVKRECCLLKCTRRNV
jgi:hypothetical protein